MTATPQEGQGVGGAGGNAGPRLFAAGSQSQGNVKQSGFSPTDGQGCVDAGGCGQQICMPAPGRISNPLRTHVKGWKRNVSFTIESARLLKSLQGKSAARPPPPTHTHVADPTKFAAMCTHGRNARLAAACVHTRSSHVCISVQKHSTANASNAYVQQTYSHLLRACNTRARHTGCDPPLALATSAAMHTHGRGLGAKSPLFPRCAAGHRGATTTSGCWIDECPPRLLHHRVSAISGFTSNDMQWTAQLASSDM